MMMLLMSSGSGGDMSNMMLMMMMMGGNMDPMMMMMMTMNTCKEPVEDCTEINNDDKLLCGIKEDIPAGGLKTAVDALTGSSVIKPCCKCTKKK